MNNLQQIESEKSDLVYLAVMHAMEDMDDIRKESFNPFHKNKYASLAQFINATDHALKKHGLILLNHLVGEHDKPMLCLQIRHIESGQWIKSFAALPNTKADCQGLGSAITYMRRYAMSALFNLCAEKDDDGNKACKDVADDSKKENSGSVARNTLQPNTNMQQNTQQAPLITIEQAVNAFMARNYTNDSMGSLKKKYVMTIAKKCNKTEFQIIESAVKNEQKFMEQFNLWTNKNS